MRAGRSLIILFTATAGFAVTVRQSLVLADPPVAYYRLGEAPGSTSAVDSSANAHDGIYRGTSTWRVLKWNAPFTIEAWVQVIDDYQVNSRILGEAETGTGSGYGLDVSLSEASLSGSTNASVLTPSNDSLAEARGVLDEVATHNYAPTPARVEAQYEVETVFETSAATSLLGLTLILFGLGSRGWRRPLKFRGNRRGLSRARIFQAGAMQLRERSETELNSFSACYATIEVRAKAPLAGGGLDWRGASRYARH
jgi:hypothetical protein